MRSVRDLRESVGACVIGRLRVDHRCARNHRHDERRRAGRIGQNGMDVVYASTGTVTTLGNQLSSVNCGH